MLPRFLFMPWLFTGTVMVDRPSSIRKLWKCLEPADRNRPFLGTRPTNRPLLVPFLLYSVHSITLTHCLEQECSKELDCTPPRWTSACPSFECPT